MNPLMALVLLKHKKHKNKRQKSVLINSLIIPIAALQPLMTLPQIMAIFTHKSARDVSILTWIAYNVASVFWLYYGIVHRERAIIISQVLWLCVQTAVIVGILIYR